MERNDVMNLVDPPNGIKDQVINAAIMAGVNFFTTLAGISAAGLMEDPATGVLAAGLASGVSFFTTLAIQRGLMKAK